jgi:hypothetical protein
MGIKMIGRLQPVRLPSEHQDTFITVYDFPDGENRRLRLAFGNMGVAFDLPESEVRRFAAIADEWLKKSIPVLGADDDSTENED